MILRRWVPLAPGMVLASVLLAGCDADSTAMPDIDRETAEYPVDDVGTTDLPRPELDIVVDGEPFLARPEESCLLRSTAGGEDQEYVFSFVREPDDGLVIRIGSSKDTNRLPELLAMSLVIGDTLYTHGPSPIDEFVASPRDHGQLAHGRFAVRFDVPQEVATDASGDGSGPSTAPPTLAVTGTFSDVFCLELGDPSP